MRKHILLTLALTTAFFFQGQGKVAGQSTPKRTAVEIVDGFIVALGGEEELRKIRLLELTTKADSLDSNILYSDGNVEASMSGPGGIRFETKFDGNNWFLNGTRLTIEKNCNELLGVKYSFVIPTDAIRLRSLVKDKVVLATIIANRMVEQIRIDGENGYHVLLSFDPITHLLVRRSEGFAGQIANTDYIYHKIDGINFVDRVTNTIDGEKDSKKSTIQTFAVTSLNGRTVKSN